MPRIRTLESTCNPNLIMLYESLYIHTQRFLIRIGGLYNA